MVVKKRN